MKAIYAQQLSAKPHRSLHKSLTVTARDLLSVEQFTTHVGRALAGVTVPAANRLELTACRRGAVVGTALLDSLGRATSQVGALLRSLHTGDEIVITLLPPEEQPDVQAMVRNPADPTGPMMIA